MFGFPKELSEFGLKEYLRLTVIVCAYILARPLIQKLFAKMHERGQAKERRQQEDKMAQRYREQRIKEKLGIPTEVEVGPDGFAKVSESTAALTAAGLKPTAAGARKQNAKKKKASTPKEKFQNVLDDFDSDEDVSDLLPTPSAPVEAVEAAEQ